MNLEILLQKAHRWKNTFCSNKRASKPTETVCVAWGTELQWHHAAYHTNKCPANIINRIHLLIWRSVVRKRVSQMQDYHRPLHSKYPNVKLLISWLPPLGIVFNWMAPHYDFIWFYYENIHLAIFTCRHKPVTEAIFYRVPVQWHGPIWIILRPQCLTHKFRIRIPSRFEVNGYTLLIILKQSETVFSYFPSGGISFNWPR